MTGPSFGPAGHPVSCTADQRCMTTHTFSPLVHQYLGERRRRGEITIDTARNTRCHLGKLERSFGARPIEQFGDRAIDRFLETCGHLSPASRRSHLSSVRTFSRWLQRRGLIAKDPTLNAVRIRQPRSVPRAMPASDVARLLEVAPDARARCIVWLMVGLGLRCCEVARLRLEDYDRDAQLVVVTGKGDHERVLPITGIVRAAIEAYLAETGTVSGHLVRSRLDPTRGLAPDTISRMVAHWMWAAGVKHRIRDGVSAHALRHTCASDVLDVCGDIRVVQVMLGHQHLATTARYLRRAQLGELRDAMEGRTYDGDDDGPPST